MTQLFLVTKKCLWQLVLEIKKSKGVRQQEDNYILDTQHSTRKHFITIITDLVEVIYMIVCTIIKGDLVTKSLTSG